MVFFTCDACGESLKKVKVSQHLYQCHSQSVTCIDCQKVFGRNDYNWHTQCISEDQKYGGLDYQPKESSNKGKAKQEEWISKLRSAIDKSQTTPHIKNLMQKLMHYDNIPRKQKKFENFVKSCLRVTNTYYIEQMWTICETCFPSQSSNGSANDSTSDTIDKSSNGQHKRSTEEAEPEFTKTKKNKRSENEVPNGVTNDDSQPSISGTADQKMDETIDVKPIKITIKKVVVEVLNDWPTNEMSLKKLRKRVWKTFKRMEQNYQKETVVAKFDRKIHKIKKIEVNDGRVSLKT